MKKTILMALATGLLVLTSCDDMLDLTPRDRFTNDPSFWSNENQVESYCNKFYEVYPGYGTAGSGGWFYFKSLSDDQAGRDFTNWTFTTIPGKSSYWSDGFTEVRRANYLIDGMKNSSLSSAKKATYLAEARLHRAYQYYQLVRMYGDVQWQSSVILDPADEAVYGTRTDRDVVMDSVLADIDYAVANLGANSDKTQFSKNMALAMKSEICLYEGTYCKYRTQAENGKAADAGRAQKYLQECVAAAEQIINSGKYSLTANYGDIYNSLALGSNSEVIFYRNYEKDVKMHSLVDYTCGTTQQDGLTRDAIESFLFLDGKPLATTTLDKNDAVQPNAAGLSISKMLSVRDKRLAVITDTVVCIKGHGWMRPGMNGEMTASTGYTIHKYDNYGLELYYRNNINTNYTDAPLYWLAEIYLNYAEAKAELGTITQSDLDATINKLQARAGLPGMTLSPEADPANNMGVSNLIWEIRRCRRCELMTDNWIRYWDLVRWHQLDKLDTEKYPKVNEGANIAGVSNAADYDLVDGYMRPYTNTRKFEAKYYFFPVPSNQITLNPATTQNPGW